MLILVSLPPADDGTARAWSHRRIAAAFGLAQSTVTERLQRLLTLGVFGAADRQRQAQAPPLSARQYLELAKDWRDDPDRTPEEREDAEAWILAYANEHGLPVPEWLDKPPDGVDTSD